MGNFLASSTDYRASIEHQDLRSIIKVRVPTHPVSSNMCFFKILSTERTEHPKKWSERANNRACSVLSPSLSFILSSVRPEARKTRPDSSILHSVGSGGIGLIGLLSSRTARSHSKSSSHRQPMAWRRKLSFIISVKCKHSRIVIGGVVMYREKIAGFWLLQIL